MKTILTFLLVIKLHLSAAEIAVVSLAAGQAYHSAVQASIKNKKEYCLLHGYDFICCDYSLDPTRHPAWSKILVLLETLSKNYKWVFWTDSDSLIMNFSIRLEELIDEDYDFIICGDKNIIDLNELTVPGWKEMAIHVPNICTGEFLLKNSDWSRLFLQKCYGLKEFITHPWWEQAAMMDILAKDGTGECLSKTKIIPYRLLGSFPQGHSAGNTFVPVEYKEGDFIIHFAGTRNLNELQQLLTSYGKQTFYSKVQTLDDYLEIYGYHLPFYLDQSKFDEWLKELPSTISTILLIGFDSGHLAEKCLNHFTQSSLLAIDKQQHYYSSAAVEYCRRWFDKRFDFYQGKWDALPSGIHKKYDLIIINSTTSATDCLDDIKSCLGLVHSGTTLWITHCELPGTRNAVLKAAKQNLIEICKHQEFKNKDQKLTAFILAKRPKNQLLN